MFFSGFNLLFPDTHLITKYQTVNINFITKLNVHLQEFNM